MDGCASSQNGRSPRTVGPLAMTWLAFIALASVCVLHVAAQGRFTWLPLLNVNDVDGGIDGGASLGPPVHVALCDPAASIEVSCDGPVRVVAAADRRPLASLTSLRSTTVRVEQGRLIGLLGVAGDVDCELIPSTSWIRVRERSYRGTVRLHRQGARSLIAVNVLPLERYVACVVASEMPGTFGDAALTAQAVVARSYALHRIRNAREKSLFDLYAGERSQRYDGVEYPGPNGQRWAGETVRSRAAAGRSRGQVLEDDDGVVLAYYSSTCGGRTMRGDAVFPDASPVLKSVECNACGAAPKYRWTTSMPRSDFERAIGGPLATSNGPQRSTTHASEVRPFRSSGWQAVASDLGDAPMEMVWHEAVSPRQVASRSNDSAETASKSMALRPARKSIDGVALRSKLPASTLWSPRFVVHVEGDRVQFEGRGHGHGAGLCQWGAAGQAAAGRDWREIVLHYYPGARLATAY